MMLSELIQCHVFLGRWDESTVRLLPEMLISEQDAVTNFLTGDAALVAAARGDDTLLERCIALASPKRDAADPEFRAMARVTLAREAIERGRFDEVVELLRSVVVAQEISGELRSSGYTLATDAALRGSDHAAISELSSSLEQLEPVEVTPVRLAQGARLRAEQAHLAGDRERTAVEERRAVDLLRSVEARPLIADALLDSVRRGGDPEALVQARTIYEELGATAWLARLETGLEVTA